MFRKSIILAVTSALTAIPAMAQAAGTPALGNAILEQMLFIVPLGLLFYFLVIRPQNRQRRQHQAMLDSVRRGDTIVTSGGLIGKVTKVTDDELVIELAENVRVRIVRRMVVDVRGKGQLVPANDAKPS